MSPSPLGSLLFALIVGLPILWLVSEFRWGRPARIILGVLAMVVTTVCLSALYSIFTNFGYNSWYGSATKDLIQSSLIQIEDGHLDRVLQAWRGLNSQYWPTYENRADYQKLAAEATARIRGEKPIEPGSRWDVPVLGRRTWVGHWENDTGYWIVIHDGGREMSIYRSGKPETTMQFVSVSEDFRVLKFKEDNLWLHTLTLKNKYEATHEWFDMDKQAVWSIDSLHKLRRATEEEKRMTQQEPPR
jgi:hypothetical protein